MYKRQVENGRIIDKNLKRLRITINELMMKLREKDVFNLEDVQFAIMESNGQLSVLIKANKQPITPYDMELKVKSSSLVNDIIIDGKIVDKNIKIAGIDQKLSLIQISLYIHKNFSRCLIWTSIF